MSGLRRKSHFDDQVGALSPNIALPQYIANQIVDSPYFTRLLGNDLSETNDAIQEQQDNTLERQAQQQNVPLAELRTLVDSMRPVPDLRPFEGQAEHEARAAQLDLGARLEQQRVGLATWHREQTTAREAQAALAQES
jgi:hypothetical protein